MTRPSPHELLAETARLAFHFHWPLDTLLDLEHRDRRAFLAQAEELAAAAGARTPVAAAPLPLEAPPEPAELQPVDAMDAGPVVDLEAIKDERVRKLFQTYFEPAP